MQISSLSSTVFNRSVFHSTPKKVTKGQSPIAKLLKQVVGFLVLASTLIANAKAGEIPSGTIAAFLTSDCPTDWSKVTEFNGRFLVGAGNYVDLTEDGRLETANFTVGRTGGELNHTLTSDENAKHYHDLTAPRYFVSNGWLGDGFVSGNPINDHSGKTTQTFSSDESGLGKAHNNLPPYFAVTFCKKDEPESSEKIGIGKIDPQATLDVNGQIRAIEICDTDGINCKDTSTAWALSETEETSLAKIPQLEDQIEVLKAKLDYLVEILIINQKLIRVLRSNV